MWVSMMINPAKLPTNPIPRKLFLPKLECAKTKNAGHDGPASYGNEMIAPEAGDCFVCG